jgi:hypothetical protein
MRALVTSASMLFVFAPPLAWADAPPWCDPCPPLIAPRPEEKPPRPKLDQGDAVNLAIGSTLLAAALAISASHFVLTSSTPARIADLVPVFGPVALAARADTPTGWMGGLLFVSWAQVAGAALIWSAFPLRRSTVEVGVSGAPGTATLRLAGRF